MEEGVIRVEAKFSKQFFPKFDEHISDGDFGIISWEVLKVIEGNPQMHSFFKTITVVGNMQSFSRLETYTIIAREAPNNYGMQYDLVYMFQPADMGNADVQRSFLNRILTPTQVDNLFMEFDNPVEIIDNHDVVSLCKVKGIKEATAKHIIKSYEENKDYSKVYVELDSYGITNNMMQKLVETYGSPEIVINKVKTNPYQLASEVKGIGFRRADEIALEHGLEWDSLFRIQGYIEFSLEQTAEEGNSFVYADELMYMIDTDLGDVGKTKIGEAVNTMVAEGIIGLENGVEGEHKKVYLTSYRNLEKEVAHELKRIMGAPNHLQIGDWKTMIKDTEERQGWVHTEEQVEAIQLVLDEQVSIIHGRGGTGKTSVVTAMLEALGAKIGRCSFAQTALSGRASAKLQEVTGEEGYTIHRLLGYNPAEGFTHTKDNPLDYDIIILDEISLVGGRIFLDLIQAVRTGAKLVMLGDDGQLESIGCMNLARDLIESNSVPSKELNQIHRQAQRSGIILAASDIREHKQLCDINFRGVDIRGELQDFELNVVEDLTDTRPTMIQYFKEWLPKVNSIMDIQLLVPVNDRGDASVAKLNDDVQSIYNPPNPRRLEMEVMVNKKKDEKFIIREMDKVMVMKNNYKTLNEEYEEVPVFNGWIGIVRSIRDDGGILVHFPMISQDVILPSSFLISVRLGYACSVHKYQGSSAKVVIGGLDYSTPPKMRTKELAYTMATRAEFYCVIVTQAPAMAEAINTSGVSDKNTFLVNLLK